MEREAMSNLGLKVFALVLAIGMWFYITKGLGLERDIQERIFKDVEVKVLSSRERHITSQITPGTIDLRLRGKEAKLETLTGDEITAFVDASTFEEGKYERIPIQLILPSDVEMVTKPPTCEVVIKEGF